MPRDTHTTEHHDEAAKSHGAGAAHGKNDDKMGHGHSQKATDASTKANDPSKQAQAKNPSKTGSK